MSRLRTYAPMRRVSLKRQRQAPDFRAVYRLVDQRSEGRCEVWEDAWLRCRHRATDHHHCLKPRASHHDVDVIVHLCRGHHERCDYPYQRGRLVVTPLGQGRFTFEIRYAKRA